MHTRKIRLRKRRAGFAAIYHASSYINVDKWSGGGGKMTDEVWRFLGIDFFGARCMFKEVEILVLQRCNSVLKDLRESDGLMGLKYLQFLYIFMYFFYSQYIIPRDKTSTCIS